MAFPLRSATNWCHDFPKLARESGFRFNRHGNNVHVDWKCISSIDIDRVIRERDLSAIDDNVNNIVDCCLESEYDVKILDRNFVKLFRLAQLAIEYLLYCKRYLDHSVVILKDELRSKIEENAKLNKQVSANEEIVKELKERLKDKNRSIESKLSDSHGEIHKCPHCPKTFISSVFMNAHLNRRHSSSSHNFSELRSSSPIIDERYRAEAEKLHNEIKTLKERLNLTERLIRKASDKPLLSPDSVSTSKNDRKQEYPDSIENDKALSQVQSNVEQESRRRYQEEIKTFKDTLFSEIRQQNLKLANSLSFARDETDDFANGNAKELIRQQEQEIQQLRDQLYKRLTPDIEDIQVKLNNQEDLWQSKIENIERRHRDDIEKLYTQLKITRESADQMRNDYISKINDLERESQERRAKSNHFPDRDVKSEGNFFPSERHENATLPNVSDDHDDSENENIPLLLRSQQKNNFVASKSDFPKEEEISNEIKDESETNDRNKKRKRKLWVQSSFTFPRESQKPRTNGSNKNHSSSPFKTNFKGVVNSRENSSPKSLEAEKTEKLRVKEAFATIKNVAQQSPIRVSQREPIRRNKSVVEKLKSDDSPSESEAELAQVHRVNKSLATVENVAQQSPIHRSVTNLPIRRNKSVAEKLKSDDSESESEAESAEDHQVNKSFAANKNVADESPIRRSATNVSERINKSVRENMRNDDSASESEAESREVRAETEKFATIKNAPQQSSIYRSATKKSDRKNKSVKNKIKSNKSSSESEESSSSISSSSSESWSESESPEVPETIVKSDRENNEKSRKSRIEVKSNNQNEPLNQEESNDNDIYARRRNSKEFESKDMIEELNSKLRDLGVDPEWQGIPKATLKQIMETVRHHRNLSSKKYRNLDEIRRELFEQINQKLSSETKIVRSTEAPNTESSMDRFLKNVKGAKAWKALSLIDKNDGSHKSPNNKKGTRRRSADQIEKSPKINVPKNSTEITENEHFLRRSLRPKSSREQANCDKSDESQSSKRTITRVGGNNNSSSRKSLQSAVEISEYRPSDLKDLSHSYESLRSFNRYRSANNNQRQQNAVWEGKIESLETLVTSSPLRKKEIENIAPSTRQVRESSLNLKKDSSTIKTQDEEEDEEFTKSPRDRIININRSVIKSSTRGSTASLVKKKVLFDLENTEKGNAESSEEKDFYGKTTKDSGESDCEISSINEDINDKEDKRDDKQSGTVVLKTLQSEKIAEISKKIEQQLSVARRKPVGSVEAMFADKKSFSESDKKFDIHETQNRRIGVTSSGRNLRAAEKEKFGSKDSNLDKDIDELLEIE